MSELRKIVEDRIRDQRGAWNGHPAALDVATWAKLEQRITDELRAAVRRARVQGATWQNIADVFGTTRSAAQKRFGEVAE